ncbi:MAG: TRAM domain-containing protein, partial [Planctomycetes bacterium]|nr:TRAM domain-containing protein [Planctomycetota bacterium]
RRNNELLALQSEISQQRKQALIGREVEVVVEGPSKSARKAQGEARSQQRTRGKHSPTFSRKRTAGSASNRALSASEGSTTSGRSGPQTRQNADARQPTTQLVGRTPGDLMAVFDAPTDYIGAIVKVRVESASPHTLFGHVTAVVSAACGAAGATETT